MGKRVGRDGVLKNGTDVIAHVRNWSINEASPQIDLTAMGDQFADQAAGLPSISGEFEMWWDDAADAGQGTLVNGAEFDLEVYPVGEGSGNTIWTVTIAISDLVRQAAHDGGIEFNCAWVGRSVVTESAVP